MIYSTAGSASSWLSIRFSARTGTKAVLPMLLREWTFSQP